MDAQNFGDDSVLEPLDPDEQEHFAVFRSQARESCLDVTEQQ